MEIKFSSLRCLLHQARELLRIPSTSMPAFLPDEVIFDILSRVPVKSVCRFRCVSKGWRAIVSDPIFIAARKPSPAELLLVVGSSDDDSSSSLRLVNVEGTVVRVINDCTGYKWTPVCSSPIDDVLCVTGYSKGAPVAGYSKGAPVAGLIDLTTMKQLLATHLGTDRAWGFGRAVPSDAYKVVRFNSFRECEVLTLGDTGDASWRRRKSFPFRADAYNHDNYTAAINGVLHFLAVALPDTAGGVLRFDLETEEWKSRIRGPPNMKLGRLEISLGELNGALCIVEPGIGFDDYGHTNIWLLTDSDMSQWVKAYTIPLNPSTYHQMMPLRVFEDGWKLLFRYYYETQGAPVLNVYDHKYGTCTDAMSELLGDHVSGVGVCSLHLEGFISRKRSISLEH